MSPVDLSPEAISASINRLRLLRHRLARSAPKPDADGSLVPILRASAEVCALDNAVRILEAALKASAS